MRPCANLHGLSLRTCPTCRVWAGVPPPATRPPSAERPAEGRGGERRRPGPPRQTRTVPCFYLGPVVDRRGCGCAARWTRGCAVHGTTTIERCKRCPDYEALE